MQPSHFYNSPITFSKLAKYILLITILSFLYTKKIITKGCRVSKLFLIGIFQPLFIQIHVIEICKNENKHIILHQHTYPASRKISALRVSFFLFISMAAQIYNQPQISIEEQDVRTIWALINNP